MLLSHLKSGFQEVGDAGFETNELTNILIASTHIEIWRKVANQDLCGCFMLQFQKLHLFNFYDIDIPIFNNMNMGDFAKLTIRVSNSSNRIKLSNCVSVNFYEPMPLTFLIQFYFNQNSETWFLDFEGKLQHSLKFLWSIRNETIKVFSAAPNYDDGNPLCQNILTKFSNISNLDASKWCEMWEPHLHINNTTSTNYSWKTRILPDKNNEIFTVSYSFFYGLWLHFYTTVIHLETAATKKLWVCGVKLLFSYPAEDWIYFRRNSDLRSDIVSHFCF